MWAVFGLFAGLTAFAGSAGRGPWPAAPAPPPRVVHRAASWSTWAGDRVVVHAPAEEARLAARVQATGDQLWFPLGDATDFFLKEQIAIVLDPGARPGTIRVDENADRIVLSPLPDGAWNHAAEEVDWPRWAVAAGLARLTVRKARRRRAEGLPVVLRASGQQGVGTATASISMGERSGSWPEDTLVTAILAWLGEESWRGTDEAALATLPPGASLAVSPVVQRSLGHCLVATRGVRGIRSALDDAHHEALEQAWRACLEETWGQGRGPGTRDPATTQPPTRPHGLGGEGWVQVSSPVATRLSHPGIAADLGWTVEQAPRGPVSVVTTAWEEGATTLWRWPSGGRRVVVPDSRGARLPRAHQGRLAAVVRTASGERVRLWEPTGAHRDLPLPPDLRVQGLAWAGDGESLFLTLAHGAQFDLARLSLQGDLSWWTHDGLAQRNPVAAPDGGVWVEVDPEGQRQQQRLRAPDLSSPPSLPTLHPVFAPTRALVGPAEAQAPQPYRPRRARLAPQWGPVLVVQGPRLATLTPLAGLQLQTGDAAGWRAASLEALVGENLRGALNLHWTRWRTGLHLSAAAAHDADRLVVAGLGSQRTQIRRLGATAWVDQPLGGGLALEGFVRGRTLALQPLGETSLEPFLEGLEAGGRLAGEWAGDRPGSAWARAHLSASRVWTTVGLAAEGNATADDGAALDRYAAARLDADLQGSLPLGPLQVELGATGGWVDRNVAPADELAAGGFPFAGTGYASLASLAPFPGYVPFSIAGETLLVARAELVAPLWQRRLVLGLGGDAGNAWSYAPQEGALLTPGPAGRFVAVDPSAVTRQRPFRDPAHGAMLLADLVGRVAVSPNGSWSAALWVARPLVPALGPGDRDQDGVIRLRSGAGSPTEMDRWNDGVGETDSSAARVGVQWTASW